MNYIHIQEVLSKAYEDKKVNLRGWVYRKREQKQLVFIILRDNSNTIQCVVKEGSKAWKAAQKITIESSCTLSGIVHQDKRAPTGYELQVEDLEIVGLAERFPIAKDLSEEFLLDVRHLAIRSPRLITIFRIRSKIFEAVHEYLRNQGYFEAHPPMICPVATEGGSEVFKVDYFGKEATLSQSWQLYAEAMIFALEKVYYIGPSFRAEKSRTQRHVTEFWHAEIEAAWVDWKEMMQTAEELIAHVAQKVAKDCKDELKSLGKDPEVLAKIKAPFKHYTYEEALEVLHKKGNKIKYGEDLGVNEERLLTEDSPFPIVIMQYPKKIMAFYKKKDPKHPKLALNFNILTPEIGETLDSSQREEDIKEIIKSLKAEKKDLKQFETYLDTRRYGSVPHSGFGLGMERLVMWICGLDTIKDAIAFPRTPTRYYP